MPAHAGATLTGRADQTSREGTPMDTMPIGTVSTPNVTREVQLATPPTTAARATTTGALGVATGYDATAAVSSTDPLAHAARTSATSQAGEAAGAANREPAYAHQRQQLLEKVVRLGQTVDPTEAKLLEELLRRSDERGSFLASELARVMVRVEGSARNLPSDYLAAADRAQRLAGEVEAGMQDLVLRFQELQRSGGATTAELMELFEALEGLASELERVQVGLRRNFELASQDPRAALEQLEAALAA